MSPLASPPQRGYPDWGRVVDWDSPLLFSINRAATQNSDTSGFQDVSRFETVALNGFCNPAAAVAVRWALDPAGVVSVGDRLFVLSPGIIGAAAARLTNLGPFVRMSWAGIGGANFANVAKMFASNRGYPLEWMPNNALLRSDVNVAVGAAGSVQVFPSDYYAGPVSAIVESAGGNTAFLAQAFTPTGTAISISPTVTPAAGVVAALDFVAPAGAWWILVFNPGAATTYTITAVPSMTGSS